MKRTLALIVLAAATLLAALPASAQYTANRGRVNSLTDLGDLCDANELAVRDGTDTVWVCAANVAGGASTAGSYLTTTAEAGLSNETVVGTGVATALGVNVESAGAVVLFNGAGGTPSSIVLNNATGTAASLTAGAASAVAVGGITGLGANCATFLATPTTANFIACITGETGTGAAVFGTTPTIATPNITGKVTANGVSVSDDDCTGELGKYWFDDTDAAFEFCNANSGAPTVLGGGGGGVVDAEYIVGEANGTLSAEVAPSAANQVPNSSGSTAAAWTATPTLTSLAVDTEAYDATGWNGDLTVPTKDSVRDILETFITIADPEAHRLMGWDNTDNAVQTWTIGAGITYTQATDTITADLGTAITSTEITDGEIVNTDINASAAIVLSKLATQAANTVVVNNTGSTAVPTAVATDTFMTSRTITTPTIVGAVTFPDNVRQTFNPGASASGFNFGSVAGDPSTPSNGDVWYDSTGNLLRARINGATVSLGAAGGGGGDLSAVDIDTSGELAVILGDETGNGGGFVRANNATLTTPTISGAIVLPDDTRQTFNPGANAAGLNVGAVAGDPVTPSDGDIWYDSTGTLLRARINGVSVSMGAGGGDALTTNPLSQFAATTSAQLRGVLSDEDGTGVFVTQGGNIGAATATTPGASDNDTSVATTNFVTDSTVTFTGKTYDASATGNSLVFKIYRNFPVALCNNATATSLWNLPTTDAAVPACRTGTNLQRGVLDFADGASLSAQTHMRLPPGWQGSVDFAISWVSTVTTGDVVWQIAGACVSSTESDDPAFTDDVTAGDAAQGTANLMNLASNAATTLTGVGGCSPNDILNIRIKRDSAHASDTMAGTASLVNVQMTYTNTH